jgi:hypothetical protein
VSVSFREALRAAARGEPGVGDAYTRFVHRRRRRRGMRFLSGLVVGAIVTVGFVQVYPGVDGGVPQQGFIPGSEVDPAIGAVREHSTDTFTVRYPSSWSLDDDHGLFRLTRLLPDSMAHPGGVEVWFGESCADRDCFWPAMSEAPATVASQGGVRIEASAIKAGSVRSEALLMRYPVVSETLAYPWCSDCVILRYDSPLGKELPVLIVGPNETAIRQAEEEIAYILASLELLDA